MFNGLFHRFNIIDGIILFPPARNPDQNENVPYDEIVWLQLANNAKSIPLVLKQVISSKYLGIIQVIIENIKNT